MTQIFIDSRRKLGAVDRRIFGGFVEHLGRCIYGGLYDEGSALSDERGFRTDVLGLLRDLRLSVLRWPGGNFVSNYHWQDGIGPLDQRPVRSELAWSGTESNRFGTDEFMQYCGALGAEPYFCFNMGTGDLAEALAWVEYCNGQRATYWADQRRANGHEEAYGVRWWGLGNEVYGEWQIGAMSAEEYIAEATRWARAIKLIDPSARLVSCGELGWTDWDRKVIDALAPLVDLHSVHLYSGSEDYWRNVLAPHNAERAISVASGLLRRAAYSHRLSRAPRLVYDEWNVWYRNMSGALEERFNFSDALAVGTYLNIFVRNCEWVAMANLAQMVNAIAPVVTTADGAVVQPIYYPFLLHSTSHLAVALDALVVGEQVPAPAPAGRWPYPLDDLGPFNLIDAAVTTDEPGSRLALTVVNRAEQAERVEIRVSERKFTGPARVRYVTADGDPPPVPGVQGAALSEFTESPGGEVLVLDMPASSFACVEVPVGA
jgi:alpha-N-arabinofuranosidase